MAASFRGVCDDSLKAQEPTQEVPSADALTLVSPKFGVTSQDMQGLSDRTEPWQCSEKRGIRAGLCLPAWSPCSALTEGTVVPCPDPCHPPARPGHRAYCRVLPGPGSPCCVPAFWCTCLRHICVPPTLSPPMRGVSAARGT